jgi:PhoH-like ATPase
MQEAVLLDTSVLIHDPLSIKSYGEDVQVLIPIFVVMELDVLKDMSKREKAHVGALARQASNLILEAIKDQSVIIVTHQDAVDIKSLDRASQIRYVDLLILQTSIYQNQHYRLTLVSKDVNLRIIAESYDIKTSDYVSDSISSNIYDSLGLREFTPSAEFATSLIKSYWEGPVNIPFDSDLEAFQNEYLWFTDFNGKKHTFQYKDWTLFPVDKVSTSKAKPRNLEQRVALDMLLDPEVQLVSLLGKAGTGKTFLALAAALDQTNLYNRILLSKPVVDVGKGIGFLPGSLSEKMEPWMQSFFDNLDQINPLWDTAPMGMEAGSKEIFLEKNQIEIQPIHSIRGRSLKQAYMIIDEAQNLTKHEIKSIITRAAEGTKVVLLGDPYQVDHPYLDTNSNGLVYVIEKMKGQSIFGCVSLHKSERSTLSDIAADLL